MMIHITHNESILILKMHGDMAFAPSGPDWVNAQSTGLSFIYNTQGGDVRPPVAIPSPRRMQVAVIQQASYLTVAVVFELPNGNPARFIFVGDDGVISGWNGGNVAIRTKDNSSTASYTGLAIAADGADSFIYAANFLSGHIEVYDTIGQRYPGNLSQIFFFPRVMRHLIFRM